MKHVWFSVALLYPFQHFYWFSGMNWHCKVQHFPHLHTSQNDAFYIVVSVKLYSDNRSVGEKFNLTVITIFLWNAWKQSISRMSISDVQFFHLISMSSVTVSEMEPGSSSRAFRLNLSLSRTKRLFYGTSAAMSHEVQDVEVHHPSLWTNTLPFSFGCLRSYFWWRFCWEHTLRTPLCSDGFSTTM